jgi:uncharacterized repeat protein (TIGR01451 family)
MNGCAVGRGHGGDEPCVARQSVLVAPDLLIAKSHSGSFTQGQVGALWTLVVTNEGTAPTIAPVNVIDTLPPGATATQISGTGWTCVLPSLACSRNDALQAAGSWPPISVLVTLDPLIATGTIVNAANVSGGGESVTSNNAASDPAVVTTRVLLPPLVTKTSIDIDANVVEWRIVIVNNANTLPLTMRLNDVAVRRRA